MSRFNRLCGLAVISLLVLTAIPVVAAEPSRLDQVLDAIAANEAALQSKLASYRPLVETYLQAVEPDELRGAVPAGDSYFIGRLELPGPSGNKKAAKRRHKKTLNLFDGFGSEGFKPESLARMLIVDSGRFDRAHYRFEFIRSEFLGEVRSLVFDVAPRADKANRMGGGRFTGRIWVEDEAYHVVRFNGIYTSALASSFHFDSWRLQMPTGDWLPAYVYTEESARESKRRDAKRGETIHKGQTRVWAYRLERPDVDDEFTKVLIEAPKTDDPSDRPGRISPLASARAWESEAEENLLQRLERAGLLAPEGKVDDVLATVVANLEISNELEIQEPVRCRVLLTTPLESFTIGNTIVLSRGLIDVLPDEASLAMVLAHELGHVLSGHELDTQYAFSNRMLVGDKQALARIGFERSAAEELEADVRAVELLENSPYNDKLPSAGLFLKILAATAENLPALIRPHFGHRMERESQVRMSRIAELAPELDPASLTQIAALPLGSRVHLDPWNARIELMTNNNPPVLSAREKMPFLVTPLMPYLVRLTESLAASEGASTVTKRRIQ